MQVSERDSAGDWRDKARKMEDLGYSTLFMPDHFVDTQLAPMVAISFAAAATTTLRIGMLVLGNDYKHPAVTAKEAATIDLLSDGRLEFGLGAGWMQTDYDALGMPYDRPGVRIDRLDEALAVINGAWADGPFSFKGKHYTITDYDGRPEAGAAAAPADPHRWRWQTGAAARRARGRHRRDQPEPAQGCRHRRCDQDTLAAETRQEDRLGEGRCGGSASTTSSSRSGTSSRRSPTTP